MIDRFRASCMHTDTSRRPKQVIAGCRHRDLPHLAATSRLEKSSFVQYSPFHNASTSACLENCKASCCLLLVQIITACVESFIRPNWLKLVIHVIRSVSLDLVETSDRWDMTSDRFLCLRSDNRCTAVSRRMYNLAAHDKYALVCPVFLVYHND